MTATNKARTHNLGVLFTDGSSSGLTHPFFASVLNAFKNEAEARGYDITFINHKVGTQPMTYLEHCRYRGFDGVCAACVDFYEDEVRELVLSDIPCVTVDDMFEGSPTVCSDNQDGVQKLVDYAFSLGHRRIAFIHGHSDTKVTDARIHSYRRAMKAHGLKVPDGYLVAGRYGNVEMTRAQVAELLARPDRPSCILLPDDSAYFGAQEAAREAELRIPLDISFAGYDGNPLTQSLHPRLTTIRQDTVEIGREAARLLIAHIENPEQPIGEPTRVPVELLKGETMGWCNEWSF